MFSPYPVKTVRFFVRTMSKTNVTSTDCGQSAETVRPMDSSLGIKVRTGVSREPVSLDTDTEVEILHFTFRTGA